MSRAGSLFDNVSRAFQYGTASLKKKKKHLINVCKMVFPGYMSRVGGDLYMKSILTIIPSEEIVRCKSADAHSNCISCYRVYCFLLSPNLDIVRQTTFLEVY